jgi:3-oxoacyl-[acyl-carrier protein] reductase
MGRRLAGAVAIVTGGSSGIGRATALALAREGARVVVVGRHRVRLEETVAAIGETVAFSLRLDVTREEDMEEMPRQTLARFDRIDILVAAAGVQRGPRSGGHLPYAVAAMPVEEWDAVVGTNLKGVFLSNRAVLPAMMARHRGWIVNIASSRGALYGNPYAAAYCASKFGVVGLSESLAEEVRAAGIKVTAVLPDVVDTPILGRLGRARLGESIPPDRVADLVVHLVTLPDDVVLRDPLIAPMLNSERPFGANRGVCWSR